MNTSGKGRRNEHRSRKILEALGYEVCRAAASKGPFDLWGSCRSHMVFLQCKSNCWPSALEIEAMQIFPAPPNSRKIIHRWKDRVQKPDIKELR